MEAKQLTVRGMIIGGIGTVIITMSSMFVALRLSSLPWPIIFVALASMFALKACGNTNLNEINVTHTAMSAGAMVAGALAFTLPGIWILNPGAEVSVGKIFLITIGGVILGLIFTALVRKFFIETEELPYPMGQAAAETLTAGDEGGKKAVILFVSMGLSGLFAAIRDSWAAAWLAAKGFAGGTITAAKTNAAYGSVLGFWVSPMLLSIGYVIGPVAIGVWFTGALIGDVGIMIGGQKMGLLDMATASSIKSSLGIGMMVGTGIGIIVKGIIPKAKTIFGGMFVKNRLGDSIVPMRWAPIVMVILVFMFTTLLDMGIIPSIITIVGVWIATAMSAQCTGQSGINPMEIFGVIFLLVAKFCSSGLGQTESFFVAAIIAVACGLVGDVMNDFKAGYILKTNPKAQWIAECIGGIIGAVVSVFVLVIVMKAYGPESFLPTGNGPAMFTASQANMVASMVGGISHMPAFISGMVIAVILYILNFPVMTLGLGVYLPFYMSATAFAGAVIKVITDKLCPKFTENGTGQIIAAGCLGGEAIVGVITALITAAKMII